MVFNSGELYLVLPKDQVLTEVSKYRFGKDVLELQAASHPF